MKVDAIERRYEHRADFVVLGDAFEIDHVTDLLSR